MYGIKRGFAPVYDGNSKVLILGSLPSVKSRQVDFYYGNKQNRFWKTVCGYFGEEVPPTVEEKKDFLARRRIALWDVALECEIEGSRDDTIKNIKVADVKKLLQKTQIGFIIINGGKAFEIFERNFSDIGVPYEKLSSTSPANTRFTTEEWNDALSRAFGRA